MLAHKVFFSWQSDTKAASCRSLIQAALEAATDELRKDPSKGLELVSVDRDTLGTSGSPNIAETIFGKIDEAAAFVADVTSVTPAGDGRKTPNPNVLVELGYAIKALSWRRVVLVRNLAFGAVEELPFDLRSQRVLTYTSADDATERAPERSKLARDLTSAVAAILAEPRLIRPPTNVERLKAMAPGARVRLVYFSPERLVAHDGFEAEILRVDETANTLTFKALTRRFETEDVLPLGDVDTLWERGGETLMRVRGYLEHDPHAPFRYRSRLSSSR